MPDREKRTRELHGQAHIPDNRLTELEVEGLSCVRQVQQIGHVERALVDFRSIATSLCSIEKTIPSFSNRHSEGKWFFLLVRRCRQCRHVWASNAWKPEVWSARRGQARSRLGGGSKSQA